MNRNTMMAMISLCLCAAGCTKSKQEQCDLILGIVRAEMQEYERQISVSPGGFPFYRSMLVVFQSTIVQLHSTKIDDPELKKACEEYMAILEKLVELHPSGAYIDFPTEAEIDFRKELEKLGKEISSYHVILRSSRRRLFEVCNQFQDQ